MHTYVRAYVYMPISVCVCAHIGECVSMSVYMYMFVHIYVKECVHVCMCTYVTRGVLGRDENLVISLPGGLEWTCMGAEPTRISQVDDISCVAYTCQPDRGGGSQEVNLVKRPV